MSKLTKTELQILTQAAERDDGAAFTPERMKTAAVQKITDALIDQKLMREIRTKPGMPIWRTAENGRSTSLVILKTGRDAISVKSKSSRSRRGISTNPSEPDEMVELAASRPIQPRSSSKLALVISLLSIETGVTLNAMMEATGWLPHTTRAALTGLRKRGFSVERLRDGKAGTVYRITREQHLTAAA